jgi:NAD(P)-dependent dehydrogenase (short-subunit alcohol dehydrogenase family)
MTSDAFSPPLRGRVAVVTGAAQGIGLGIAQSLGQAGARLVVNDVQGDRLDEACDALAEHEVFPIVGDVSERAAVQRLINGAAENYGGVDILVNNAGTLVNKPFLEHSEEEWRHTLAVNVGSVFLCCQAAIPLMITAGEGVVVNVASIAAFHATVPHAAYSASKAAIVALTRDLGNEMAPKGIRVNCVAPGMIKTAMASTSEAALGGGRLVDSVPLGFDGAPADVGEVVAFLASDRARFLVGQTITIAGGADLSILRH